MSPCVSRCSGLCIRYVCALKGFDTIHAGALMPMTPTHDESRRDIQHDAQPFLQLRILALAHVTVVVADSPARMVNPAAQKARWTAAEKNEMAEEIRGMFLDPEGAASLRAEKEAKKLKLEGWRLDKRDGVEKRKRAREERVKNEKYSVKSGPSGRWKTPKVRWNSRLEAQSGAAG